jgi:hypothetical protein
VQAAGLIAVILIGAVALFQIGLVLGAPWGAAAWGGRNAGRLPGHLRVASAAAIILLLFIAWIVAAAAGLVQTSPIPNAWLTPALWIATAYFGLGTLANLASRSSAERWWAPVALATGICTALVAIG